MIFTYDRAVSSGFTLVNTLVSQDHPSYLRRFQVPTKYRDWMPFASTDCVMPFGTLNQDEPFVVDPTQAFIILQLFGEVQDRVLIVLRTQALIKHACLMGTDTYIPWEEWGRDAIVMEMPTSDSVIYIQGVHVVEGQMGKVPGSDHANHMSIRVFDFSKRGCSTIRDEGGETVWAAWYEEGRELSLEGSQNMGRLELGSLGDGAFYSLVSCLRCWKTGVG